MVRGAHQPVWVDRTAELGVLDSSLELVRGGHPRAVLVMGETGVGKTALVGEFARRAGVRAFTGRCFKFGGSTVPYLPMVEILRAFAREADQAEVVRVLGPARADLARLLPELASRRGDGAESPAREGEQLERARLFERLLGVTERLGSGQPTLLVIEDAHWIDDATRDTLVFLLHTVRRAQLMLVITCRSDELPAGHPFLAITAELARAGVLERLDLQRLAPLDVEEQITHLVGHLPARRFVERIISRSQGNPLFVEELVDAGLTADANQVPSGLRDILLARVTTLSEPSRALVRFAAIAGTSVGEPLLQAAGLHGDALVTALREASDEQVLVAVERRGQTAYEFRHPLLQEVVYDDQLPVERARAHAAIARILSDGKPTGPDETAQLAHHWYAARDVARALPAAVDAGIAAYLAYAFGEAHVQFERALELWPKVPYADDRVGVDRLSLLEYASESATRVGDYRRGIELGRQILGLVDPAVDAQRAAEAHARLRWQLWESGDHAAALADAQEAVRLAPLEPPSALRANALAHLAALLMFGGRLDEALALAAESVTIARAADAVAEEALAVGIVGLSLVRHGQVDDGLEKVREALDVAQRLDHITGMAVAYSQYADVLDQLGRAEEGLAIAEQGIETAQRLGLERTFGVLLRGAAVHALYQLGRWDEALGLAGRSPAGMADDQQLEMRLTAALIDVARGRTREADEFLRGLPASALPAGDQVRWLRQQVETHLRLGQRRAAEVELDAKDIAADVEAGPWAGPRELCLLAVRALADVADAGRMKNDDRAAAEAAERARSLTELLDQPADPSGGLAEAWRLTATAELGRAAGESDPAEWAPAAAAWQVAQRPYHLAYCAFRQAEAAARSGQGRAAAEAPLRLAHESCRTLGAAGLQSEVEQLGHRLRVSFTERDSGPTAGPELTDRERDVLELLVAGRTNREIGEALYISPKTASVHVSNIFAKLGVDRRVEAVAVANSLGLLKSTRAARAAQPRATVQTDPRRLQTVVFVDIVESTQMVGRIGDRAWRLLLDRFYAAMSDDVANHGGHEVDRAGDGLLATFDEPTHAVRCAQAAARSARKLGLHVRAGIHTGEVEVDGSALRGIAVHTAARIAASAKPDEILVSATVRELAAGSGLRMEDRGLHELRGIAEPKRLYAAR